MPDSNFTYQYEIPFDAATGATGREVTMHLLVGDPVNTITSADSIYYVTTYPILHAVGTYSIIDQSGAVIRTDEITSLANSGTPQENFFVYSQPTVRGPPVIENFGSGGVSYNINNVNDSNDGVGKVTLVPIGSDAYGAPTYQEAGANHNPIVPAELPCFVRGTNILTEAGEVPVEHLAIGDSIVTASGERRPIRWIGNRTYHCEWFGSPARVNPVCIRAGAFGTGAPSRDLFVSPGHAVAVDILGKILIPVGKLINKKTIMQVQVASTEYWHIELDEHDILISDGLTTESFIDVGNRASFFNKKGAILSFSNSRKPKHCCPLVTDGPIVDAVRERLDEIAKAGQVQNYWSAFSASCAGAD